MAALRKFTQRTLDGRFSPTAGVARTGTFDANRPMVNGSSGTSIATTQLPQQPALVFVGAVVGPG
jgi:hypothetical protein